MLRQFGPSIWVAEGPVVSFYGFRYPTRMAVLRLSGGDLFAWSPIALSRDLRNEIDALGPVRHLVSPNALHHLFLLQWKQAYPDARLCAPPRLRSKRRDLRFDADLGDAADPEWAADVDQVLVAGSIALTEVVFFHHASRSVLFGDLIENFRPDWFRGWRGWLARLDGIVAPRPGAPREWRASFIHRRVARAALQRILAWPIERVVMAHGDLVTADGAQFVRRAFAWLLGRKSHTGPVGAAGTR
ncbi:MAG TPA: DUF4336 domain-containing protein [Casimicrobiaceae bacterium]|jgi:hypothetical protein